MPKSLEVYPKPIYESRKIRTAWLHLCPVCGYEFESPKSRVRTCQESSCQKQEYRARVRSQRRKAAAKPGKRASRKK